MKSLFTMSHEYWEHAGGLKEKTVLSIDTHSWEEVVDHYYSYLIACGFLLDPEHMIDYLIFKHGLEDMYRQAAEDMYAAKEQDDE